jgi:hypothetical protein
MQAADFLPTEPARSSSSTLPSPASGIRRRGAAAPDPLIAKLPTGWQLSAVMSWLLVLGVLGVLTAKLGPYMQWIDYGLQIGLITFVLMRFAWDARTHWVFGGVALVFVMLRLGLVLADRTEYQPDLDRFESTPLDPNPRAAPDD